MIISGIFLLNQPFVLFVSLHINLELVQISLFQLLNQRLVLEKYIGTQWYLL